jgi:hypothetical protein
MVYQEGAILFFNPFFFKDGNGSKPKYFIVLKVIGENAIVASLPSSQDYVPAAANTSKTCCNDLPEAGFNCFVFAANQIVTNNDWSFPKTTFLYGKQLDEYSIEKLKDRYPIEGINYEVMGKLKTKIYQQVVACFKSSAVVKRKFKNLL